MDRNELIDTIIELEWQQFTNVHNEGGRASCQDDWETFEIMRKSQFQCWTESLLESYRLDLMKAELEVWSLPAEKYARMMESTAPAEYLALKGQLPQRTEGRLKRQNEIVAQQVVWLEDVYHRYPQLEGSGRPVHTYEDTPWATSFETYQRGELGSYSDRTFELYSSFIEQLKDRGENLAEMTLSNTAKLYGYQSLSDVRKA